MNNLLSASDALVALLDGADHDDVVRMTGLPMVTVEAIFSARDRALTENRKLEQYSGESEHCVRIARPTE